jgi:hypothetical protein
MINFVTWKWRQANFPDIYRAEHVNVLEAMVRRNYDGQCRFICVTDDPEGITGETFPLWSDCDGMPNASGANFPSCYRRLKIFDPATQESMDICPDDRVISLDLDTVIVGEINSLFDRSDAFVCWKVMFGALEAFNGSLWMLRAGSHAEVWEDFDGERSAKEAIDAGFRGSDQAWISHKIGVDAPGWGFEDGVLSFVKDIRLKQAQLPPDARIVSFYGHVKPWDDIAADWPDIVSHWRM